MNIGIISKEDHAKSHAIALEALGHRVSVLGATPSEVPSSLDIIACRPASCSHRGFDVAMEIKRDKKDRREVIIADGVTEILAEVKRLSTKKPAEKGDAVGTTSISRTSALTAREALLMLSQRLGVYGSVLHHKSAAEIVRQLAVKNGASDVTQVMALWGSAVTSLRREAVRNWCRAMKTREDKTGRGDLPVGRWASIYTAPRLGGAREMLVRVVNEDRLQDLLTQSKLYSTFEEAEAARKARLQLKEPEVNPVALAEEEPEAVMEPEVEPEVEVFSPVAVSSPAQGEAAVVSAQPEAQEPEVVAPAPPVAITKVTEKTEKNWEGQLRSALELLLAEMRSSRILEVTVAQNGAITFKREVIIVRVEEGEMIIDG